MLYHMNVLWITNIEFPEVSTLLLGKESHLKGSGGWLYSLASRLASQHGLKLFVASPSVLVNDFKIVEGESVTYLLLPVSEIKGGEVNVWRKVRDISTPDVVHIHGTEMPFGLSYIEACGSNGVCVSLQGIISECAKYYNYGLSNNDILRATTLSSLFFGGMKRKAKDFEKRGETEKALLSKVQHVIGRTTWDKIHAWSLNPEAAYYHGGESLREEFYTEEKWSYSTCIPQRIFLSQASYPLKGLHMVLRAMPFIIRRFPNVTIHIAGPDITKNDNLKQRLLLGDYGNLIGKIIKQYNLSEYVSFIGSVDALGMRKEYLDANVFVCPSSVENSPNSLGEAQILGVPVVASFVGGIPDMMSGDEEHLYRYEDIESLAYKVVDVFNKKDKINTSVMRMVARQRHDPDNNVKELLQIYQCVINRV